MNFISKVLVYYYFLLFRFINNNNNALFYFSQIIFKYNLAMNIKTGALIRQVILVLVAQYLILR